MALARADRAASPPPRRPSAAPARWLPAIVASALVWLTATVQALPRDEASARALDTTRSEIGFTLRTRWGQALHGRFPRWSGVIETLPAGAHQVHLSLATDEVEIDGSRTYTRLARGPGLFDAGHHPEVVFVSEPYGPALLREGGDLGGVLSIRGVSRPERFRIEPADCERPAIDCDVIGQGDIRRSRYAMEGYGYAVADRVRFTLRIRAAGPH